MFKPFNIAAVAMTALSLAGCGSQQEQKADQNDMVSPGPELTSAAPANALSVQDQPAGSSVTVQSVSAAQNGWVVIHRVQDGKPVVPASIGHTYVKQGDNSDVKVDLLEAPEGNELIAMLHVDDGEPSVYQFGPGTTDYDKPVMKDGNPVVAKFSVQ